MKPDFFSVRTKRGQLADSEERFSDFDKQCIGLLSLTTPLSEPGHAMGVDINLFVPCVV